MGRGPSPVARYWRTPPENSGKAALPGPCHSTPSPPAYRRCGSGGLQSPCGGGAGCPAARVSCRRARAAAPALRAGCEASASAGLRC